MLKKLLKDVVTYSAGILFTRAISVILVPFYTRIFSPAQFGMMDLLSIVGSLVAITIPLEIAQSAPRFYADAPTEDQKVSYASTALWFTFGAYTVFLTLALSKGSALSSLILGPRGNHNTFNIAALSMATGGIFYFLQSQLRWEFKSKPYVISSATYSLISAISAIFFILVLHHGVSGIFEGFVVSGVLTGALAAYFLKSTFKLTFNWTKCKEMLNFSLPLVPSSLSVFIATYIDRFAIRKLMTLSDVGIFAVGYRVAAVMGIILTCFQAALSPLVFGKYRDPSMPGDLARIFRYFLAVTLPMILGLTLYSHEILAGFATAQYNGAAPVIPILALAIMLSNMYVLAPGLFLAKKTKTIAAINITAALLNTLLNFLLIPHYGILGAATATLLNATVTFCTYMVFSQKHYPIPLNWKKIGTALSFMMIFLALPMYFEEHLHHFSWRMECAKAAYALGCIGVFELLLINIREIVRKGSR